MIIASKVKLNFDKINQINTDLSGYWLQDIWHTKDAIFDDMRVRTSASLNHTSITFTAFPATIRNEVKYYLVKHLTEQKLSLLTMMNYSTNFFRLGQFITLTYPNIMSFAELNPEKALIRWKSYLVDKENRLPTNTSLTIFKNLLDFYIRFYDNRNEFEKDIWDVRNIPGVRYTPHRSEYLLDFREIPENFRPLLKRYIKFRLTIVSRSKAYYDLLSLRWFIGFIHNRYPHWIDLRLLTRNDIEDYWVWFRGHTKNHKNAHPYAASLYRFLHYIQKAQYSEAPIKPVVTLIFKEDIPKKRPNGESIKYIPDTVLNQLEEHIDKLNVPEFIPIIILLRATGWRISDILNLRYNNCLDKTPQGWWLCGDIIKTQVLNHRVPITEEVAVLVKAVSKNIAKQSNNVNNSQKYLFVRLSGARKGLPPKDESIQRALDQLAIKFNIVDDQGQLFHFKNHAFRHTKGVELINNGMNILHVQKWLAHASPEMSLTYAQILDSTMRKSWEQVAKNGLFRLDAEGKPSKVSLCDIENEDLVEWEYIRYNLDAVRMPLGYCLKPTKIECKQQLNPCLNCRSLCTSPDFIPQFELEIAETKTVIERGRVQGRSIWVEKNMVLLEKYETILGVLKSGKTHHLAGKKGREYVGEERSRVQTS